MALEKDTYTTRELCQHLRVNPMTIYRLLQEGRLPDFRVGRQWCFSVAAIQEWKRVEAASPKVVLAPVRWHRS